MGCAGIACARCLVTAAGCLSCSWLTHVSLSARLWETTECWWNLRWGLARLFKSCFRFSSPPLCVGEHKGIRFPSEVAAIVHWHCQSFVKRKCNCLFSLLSIERLPNYYVFFFPQGINKLQELVKHHIYASAAVRQAALILDNWSPLGQLVITCVVWHKGWSMDIEAKYLPWK